MLNKACILGRIGKKESKQLKNGTELTVLSIATQKKWRNPQGENQEETTWHNVQCFNKIADIANKYAHVGQMIYIEGEIQHRKQETANGEFKYYHAINCTEIKLISGQKRVDEDGNKNPGNTLQNGTCAFGDDINIPF